MKDIKFRSGNPCIKKNKRDALLKKGCIPKESSCERKTGKNRCTSAYPFKCPGYLSSYDNFEGFLKAKNTDASYERTRQKLLKNI